MNRGTMPRRPGPLHDRGQLAVVVAAEHHGVRLELFVPRRPRRLDAGEHPIEAAAARDTPEALGNERVERHREPAQPRRPQRERELLEQGPVGGEGEVFHAERSDEADELGHPRVQEGLAARHTDALDARLHERPDHGPPRVVFEPLLEVAVAARRATVDARHVAAVGERNAHGPRLDACPRAAGVPVTRGRCRVRSAAGMRV